MAKYDAMGDKLQRRVPIAVWVMLVGVITAVAGLVWCLNTDLKKYAKTENLYSDQDTDDIRDLELEFDCATVNITPSADDQIHLSIQNAPEGVYTYGVKDHTFYIKRKSIFSILRFSGVSKIPFLKDVYPEATINLQLPTSLTFEKVEIGSSLSDVSINTINCEKLEIDNGMGTLELINCRAEKTELDNGMGKMTVLDSTLGETDIDNGMGKIKLTNCVLHDSDIDNGMGEVDLNISGDGEDYRISGDHGDVDIKGRTGSSGAKYKIKIDNGLGDIDISFS